MNVEQLKREREAQFVETRTKIEMEVTKFLESIANMDEEAKTACRYNPAYTARNLLPALWIDPFDEKVYNIQLEKLQAYITAVTSVCDRMNEEALKCLQS